MWFCKQQINWKLLVKGGRPPQSRQANVNLCKINPNQRQNHSCLWRKEELFWVKHILRRKAENVTVPGKRQLCRLKSNRVTDILGSCPPCSLPDICCIRRLQWAGFSFPLSWNLKAFEVCLTQVMSHLAMIYSKNTCIGCSRWLNSWSSMHDDS